MDITLARTFLEIVDCGNFVRAAERLHVTQTAVSVRVQSLEEQLGRKLFVRNKAGATLTPAGEQFLRYAPLLIQVWERAKHQVAVPPGLRAVVAVGAELSLWNPFLIDWLVWMRRSTPQLALRTQVGLPEGLMNQVSEGILDLAVLYAPQHRQGLKVELLMKEKLVLVTTAKGKTAARRRRLRLRRLGPGLRSAAQPDVPGALESRNLCQPWAARAGIHPEGGRLGVLSRACGGAVPSQPPPAPGARRSGIPLSSLRCLFGRRGRQSHGARACRSEAYSQGAGHRERPQSPPIAIPFTGIEAATNCCVTSPAGAALRPPSGAESRPGNPIRWTAPPTGRATRYPPGPAPISFRPPRSHETGRRATRSFSRRPCSSV